MLNFTFCEPLTDYTRALWWYKVSENARANNASIFRDFNSLGFRVGNGAMCSPHKAGPGLKHLRFQFFSARFARRAAHVPGCTRQPQCTSKFSIFFRCERRAIVSVGPSAHRDFVAELKGSSGCGGVFRRRATAGSISGTPSLKLSVHVFDFGQTQAKSPEFQRTLFFSLGKRDGCPSRYLCHFFGWL